MAFDPRGFFEEYLAAINNHDRETLHRLTHPEVIAYLPQTGERTRGFDAFWAEFERYPGGGENIRNTDVRMVDDGERWALTPAFTVVPLANSSTYTVVGRATYPDGSQWRTVLGVEIRDGLLYRMEAYFAPEMPGPILGMLNSLSPSAGT